MKAITSKALAYCAFCAMGNHRYCSGRSSTGHECECGGRKHDPTVDLAAAMRLYVRADEAKLTVEQRATNWRKATGRRGEE